MRLLVAVLAAFALAASPAAAVTFNVDSDADLHDATPGNGQCKTSAGNCTLRAALEETNSLMGPDEVDVPAGTYKLSIAQNLSVTSNLTLTGTAGAHATTIDLQGLGVSVALNGSGVFVNGLAITSSGGVAAGLVVGGGEATLTGVYVHDITATTPGGNGAGIVVNGGLVQIFGSSIINNTAIGTSTSKGGGLLVQGGTVTVVASTIAGNLAKATDVGGSQALGGGIATYSTLNLRHDTLINNNTVAGSIDSHGGNLWGVGAITLTDSIILGGGAQDEQNCGASNLTVTGKNIYDPTPSDCVFPAGTVAAATAQATDLGDHGGPGPTIVPLPGSPALDAASACPDGGKDERGAAAPAGAGCDIGATEAGSDLQVTLLASSPSVAPGEPETYFAKVTNGGVDAAPSAVLTVTLPSGTQVTFAGASAGSCAAPAVCSLGTLPPGQS